LVSRLALAGGALLTVGALVTIWAIGSGAVCAAPAATLGLAVVACLATWYVVLGHGVRWWWRYNAKQQNAWVDALARSYNAQKGLYDAWTSLQCELTDSASVKLAAERMEAVRTADEVRSAIRKVLGPPKRTGGRRPWFQSADEYTVAVCTAAAAIRAQGRQPTQEAVAAYFSQHSNLPRCDDRQLREWSRKYGLDWNALISKAV
jgi:hypothetical protein